MSCKSSSLVGAGDQKNPMNGAPARRASEREVSGVMVESLFFFACESLQTESDRITDVPQLSVFSSSTFRVSFPVWV